ncbi:GNAT family N-acetyltransferase [Streptomyces sp. NPDC050546]|uniref:GNAT family N-acetyltransferase n=1 Tax=Streptomyces sp. NPDC050546 TaxID=3365628 RepID=UPI00379126FB
MGIGAGVSADLVEEVAAATRAAFADADPLPGLPAPDGAFETAAVVQADLAAGAGLWIACDASGRLLGSIRSMPKGPGAFEVRRLCVVPAALGSGLARRLVRALEAGALAAGADRVVLDAVVERGNPPVYARFGYRTVRYLPNPDKALSEVTMERVLDVPPAPVAQPCPTATLAEGTALVDWFATADGTVVAVPSVHSGTDEFAGLADRARRVGGGTHLGTDAWSGGADVRQQWRELLAGHADRMDGDLLVFGRPPSEIAPYLMPRTIDASVLALCRPYPKGPVPDGRAHG